MIIVFGNIKTSVKAEVFSTNIRIDDTESNITSQDSPYIAIDSQGTIHVVFGDWRDDVDGKRINGGGIDGVNNWEIYYANSTNGGLSFNKNRKVNDNGETSEQWPGPITIDGKDRIHAVWTDWRNDADGESHPTGGVDGVNNPDIYYSNSTDGINWSPSTRINDDGGTSWQSGPKIVIDKYDGIHMVWIDERQGLMIDDIYYANSTDGGVTFSENKIINNVSGGCGEPSISTDENGNIFVVWAQSIGGVWDVYFDKSVDRGITFGIDKKITSGTALDGGRALPEIATGGGLIGVVWDDTRGGIYFANSTDGGYNFGIDKKVSEDDGEVVSIAINSSGYIACAWVDMRDGSEDIWFANSTDGGNKFSTNQKINDDISTTNQRLPSIAINNLGTVFFAWMDYRNNNWDIYFARSNIFPSMTMPISPFNGSTLTNNTPTLKVTPVTDPDNDTVYYNFTISDQPDAESGTVYYSGWITSTSWKPPPLPDGKWYWHTYTSDRWNTTAPNWVWNFTIDTSQSYFIKLYEGWNLISIPFIQIDTNLESVLDSINGSYDAVQWYDISDALDPWKHYQISKPTILNDLGNIDHKMGFWIHITKPGGVLFECSGIIPIENQSITLKTGWNLVGYPSLTNKSRDMALNNLNFTSDVDAIWTYNASSQKWEKIGEFDYFERGRGYWVHSKVEKTWEVPI